MRTGIIAVLTCGVLLAQCVSAQMISASVGTNDYIFIRLHSSHSAWWLTVRPNGSGLIGYGSSGTDSGNFTNNTFDVRVLDAMLRVGATTNQQARESFSILVTKPNGDTIVSLWTTNTDLAVSLMCRAHDGLADSRMNDRIRTLWDGHKPEGAQEMPNDTSEGVRQPAGVSPKPSL
jgi:hypothetical protein